jgi:hypothetical protein
MVTCKAYYIFSMDRNILLQVDINATYFSDHCFDKYYNHDQNSWGNIRGWPWKSDATDIEIHEIDEIIVIIGSPG